LEINSQGEFTGLYKQISTKEFDIEIKVRRTGTLSLSAKGTTP
jgi:hypothetical protein